jgi:hypothetical protein
VGLIEPHVGAAGLATGRVKTTGIRKGLKLFGAIEFRGGAFQYREALAYTLTAKSFKHLKAAGVPKDGVVPLLALKNARYPSQEHFSQALDEVLGPHA